MHLLKSWEWDDMQVTCSASRRQDPCSTPLSSGSVPKRRWSRTRMESELMNGSTRSYHRRQSHQHLYKRSAPENFATGLPSNSIQTRPGELNISIFRRTASSVSGAEDDSGARRFQPGSGRRFRAGDGHRGPARCNNVAMRSSRRRRSLLSSSGRESCGLVRPQRPGRA
jgi:hypothetical protein